MNSHARYRPHIESVNLHQIATCGDRILLGFAHGIGPRPRRPARSRHPTARRFHQPALAFEMGKNTTRHGGLDRQLFLAQQHRQLVLAPAGKLQPQKQNFSF